MKFYRDGLGLATEGIIGREFEHGAVAFFDLAGGLRLAIWAQADIAHDTGLPTAPDCRHDRPQCHDFRAFEPPPTGFSPEANAGR